MIGKDLNFSLVNVAGNDFVQGNKKLIVGEFWCLYYYCDSVFITGKFDIFIADNLF